MHPACADGKVVVAVMTATDGPVPAGVAALVERVVAGLPGLLDDALAYLVHAVRADPRSVGLDVVPVGEVVCGEVSLVLDESDEWLVHVAACPFPAAEPYGIAVRMRGLRPVGIEVLEDAEEI